MLELLLYIPVLYISIFYLLVFLERGKNKKGKVSISSWPPVSVIIPAYNEEKSIAKTIEETLKLDYPQDKLQIIVVNDGSEDDTGKIAESYERKGLIELINQENRGKGGALNHGMEVAGGKFIACLDADSFPAPHSLKKMVRLMDEKTAAVAPAMKVHKPKKLLELMQWFEYLLGIFLKELMEKIDSVFVTPGPFSLYRKGVVQEVGGFDPDSLVEDMEIAHRLQKNQWKIKNCCEADVYTKVPSSLKEFYHQRNRWYKGGLLNAIKYREMIFNRKYGDFGFFQIPVNVSQVLVSVVVLFYLLKISLTPVVSFLGNLQAVNFQLQTFLSSISFNISLSGLFLGLNYQNYTVLAFVISFSVAMLYLSYKWTGEKVEEMKKISLALYLFFYFILVGVVCVVVLFEVITGKEERW